MNTKHTLLAIFAATSLVGATLSVASADETGTGSTGTGSTSTGTTVTDSGSTFTGSTTSTGTTSTSSTSTGTTVGTGSTQSGVVLPIIRHEMRDDRHEVRDMRQEGMQRVKDFCSEKKEENKENRQQIRVNWDALRVDTGKLRDFLKNPLSAEEKTALTALMKTHETERKAILSGSGTDAEKLAALKASLTKFLAGVKTYVATDKVAGYDAFVTARLALFDANSTLRVDNKTNMEACKNARKDMKEEIKQRAKDIKHALSEGTRNLLNAKLDAIPADQKAAFYQRLITRIDVLMAQPRTERVKAMLLEIKQIVQLRLDALQTGSMSEQDVVNEVLAQ